MTITTTYITGTVTKIAVAPGDAETLDVHVKPDDGSPEQHFSVENASETEIDAGMYPSYTVGDKVKYSITTGPLGPLRSDYLEHV